jgi:hypothetical protein
MNEAERSPRRSKTAETSSNKNPRLSFAPTTHATRVYRHNKIYRCPPTPPPEVQYNREQCFILDCKAVANISNDYSTANPKLGSVIPPYVAQFDSSVDSYFDSFGVKGILKKTGQVNRKDFF